VEWLSSFWQKYTSRLRKLVRSDLSDPHPSHSPGAKKAPALDLKASGQLIAKPRGRSEPGGKSEPQNIGGKGEPQNIEYRTPNIEVKKKRTAEYRTRNIEYRSEEKTKRRVSLKFLRLEESTFPFPFSNFHFLPPSSFSSTSTFDIRYSLFLFFPFGLHPSSFSSTSTFDIRHSIFDIRFSFFAFLLTGRRATALRRLV